MSILSFSTKSAAQVKNNQWKNIKKIIMLAGYTELRELLTLRAVH